MRPLADAIAWYEHHAAEVVGLYEAVPPDHLHRWLGDLLPTTPALVLDVGAGTGRDAAWFADLGHDVVAVEPAGAMRAEAIRLHPHPHIRWLDDSLPGLARTLRLGFGFDVIMPSTAWMHFAPGDRRRALRKTVTALKPGGLLARAGRRLGPVFSRATSGTRRIGRTQRMSWEWLEIVTAGLPTPASDHPFLETTRSMMRVTSGKSRVGAGKPPARICEAEWPSYSTAISAQPRGGSMRKEA